MMFLDRNIYNVRLPTSICKLRTMGGVVLTLTFRTAVTVVINTFQTCREFLTL